MPEITVHLDWVRYTVPHSPNLNLDTNLMMARPRHPAFDFTGETIDIGQGYNHGMRLNTGAIFWNDARLSQGISVQLTGMDLNELRKTTYTEAELLEFIAEHQGKMTTLHSCINMHGVPAWPLDIITERDAGRLKTRARNIGTYTSQSKVGTKWISGETVYIGSAKSPVQVRVYNKAAEQGIAGDWIRIEIVWRGKYARAAHTAMCAHGIEQVTRGGILKTVDFSSAWWRYATTGDSSQPAPIERMKSARYTWLVNVVLPALRSEIDAERKLNSDTLYELYAASIAELRR